MPIDETRVKEVMRYIMGLLYKAGEKRYRLASPPLDISKEENMLLFIFRLLDKQIARKPNHYKVNWGMVYKGELGVAWLDFSDIEKYIENYVEEYMTNKYGNGNFKVLNVKKVSALAVAPTVTPSKIVTMFISAF